MADEDAERALADPSSRKYGYEHLGGRAAGTLLSASANDRKTSVCTDPTQAPVPPRAGSTARERPVQPAAGDQAPQPCQWPPSAPAPVRDQAAVSPASPSFAGWAFLVLSVRSLGIT
ncbi:hypothetical protein AURDEDRAFT_178052 [Auricularia subglabra TFB-10046 SS5]|uniref:Uncharacterized protein n=1 Tax=Auricularia subglabra (strain TFB-10046 / SS5) TaxID=717982 RepID=J0CRG5_AURST|nr:hypothetical protein AURDEDRAFT_178052 [Auricularia subglabra TFB-10046 SS5]